MALKRLPTPFFAGCVQDTEVMGHRIPKGWNVIMCQWVVHRDPRFFPDPERFDPDRWADGLAQTLPRYAYFPFGGGPRLCIGNNFALLEAILLLATMAQAYEFTLDAEHPVEVQPAVTLRPRTGIWSRLRRRGGVRATA